MGRSIKTGFSYFPLDVDLDEKFELLEAEHGLKGFGVVIKLFQRIYKTEGYFTNWNNDVLLVFSKQIGEGANCVSEIVKTAIKRGIFDKDIFAKKSVLTSRGIQKQFVAMSGLARRKNCFINNEYLLLLPNEISINSVVLPINSEETPINSEFMPHSKVNKTKEKEISISKNVNNDINAREHLRESYLELMIRLGLREETRNLMFRLIQFQQLNKKVVTNKQLEQIIKGIRNEAKRRISNSYKLQIWPLPDYEPYEDEIESYIMESINQALAGKYFNLIEPKGWMTHKEAEDEARADMSKLSTMCGKYEE